MLNLVLVGGGHSHVAVLRHFGMRPMPGLRITLVSRGVYTPYSGMLPGLIAGHYTFEDAHIDLQRLARFAGARALFDEVTGLDPEARLVRCAGRPPVPYDLLSINIGSTPNVSVPGAAAHAVPVKPIDQFLQHWDALRERVLADDRPKRIAVVGGGAGGVELLLSVQVRLATLLSRQGRTSDQLEFHLFTSSRTILPTHNARTQALFDRILQARAVHPHPGTEIVEVGPGHVRTAAGERHEMDEILWTTEARAASWIAASGLATDERGFVSVGPTLQSISHPDVFSAGDVASMVGRRLEKSGVYAVREGEVLAPNLRRAAAGRRLRSYTPQRRFLSLISTGNRYAVASRGQLAFAGGWVWRWKDSIDRRFMRMYNELEGMGGRVRLKPDTTAAGAGLQPDGVRSVPLQPDARSVGLQPDVRSVRLQADRMDMRCGGCGAKVGADILTRALARLEPGSRGDVIVGLAAPDDAAVVEVPAGRLMVHTVDFFRAMIDDPLVFGRIAATHALGDLYAMGAEPQTALATVTIPYGPERQMEDTLTQLMAGAVEVLRDAGAALVGGHTSEGAELGLGFAVNGLVDRGRILRKAGLRPGDRLVLTKPIGTGTLFAADMRHQAKGAWIAAAIASMTVSNRAAADCLLRHGATACTDVTGFGLAGHLAEMVQASGVDIDLDLEAIPLLEGAEQTAAAGIVSSLQPQNRASRRVLANEGALPDTPRVTLLFDPQTAGGLLAGVPAGSVEPCIADLRAAGYLQAAAIGVVRASSGGTGRITCLV